MHLLISFLCLLPLVSGIVWMPSHFGDNMVIQTWNKYHMSAKLYGTADPGELVNATTSIPSNPYFATVADNVTGTWSIAYNLPPGSGTAGFDLTITGASNVLHFTNVRWGDVYTCIGDSSVLLPLNLSTDMINGANYLNNKTIQNIINSGALALFSVSASTASTPQADFDLSAPSSTCHWPTSDDFPCNNWIVATNTTLLSFSSLCLQTVLSIMMLPGGNPGNAAVGIVQIAANYTPITSLIPSSIDTTVCGNSPPNTPIPPSSYYNGMIAPIAEQTFRGLILSYGGSDLFNYNSFTNNYYCYNELLIQGLRNSPIIGDYPFLYPLISPSIANTMGISGDTLFSLYQNQLAVLPHRNNTSGITNGQTCTVASSNTMDTSLSTTLVPLNNNNFPPAPTSTLSMANRLALDFDYVGFWNFGRASFGPRIASAVLTSSTNIKLTFQYAPDSLTNLSHLNLLPYSPCSSCCNSSNGNDMIQVSMSLNGPWSPTTYTVSSDNINLLVVSPISNPAYIRYGASDPANYQCTIIDNSTQLPAQPFILPITSSVSTTKTFNTLRGTMKTTTNSPKSSSFTIYPSQYPELSPLHPLNLPSSSHLLDDNGNFNRTEYLIHGRLRAQYMGQHMHDINKIQSQLISPTPPMGYNTWQAARCNLDENILRRVGNAFISSGLATVGYTTVNMDDCIMRERLPNNQSLSEDEIRFPSSLFNIGYTLTSKNLGYGVYTSQSSETCVGRPASYNYEDVDTQRWCEWGFTYVKVDDCGGTKYPAVNTSWIKIREGLTTHCGERGVILSVESCGDPKPSGCGGWIRSTGAQLWRTTGDLQLYWQSILSNLDGNENMAPISGPSRFNDPDMLIIGHAGITEIEEYTHYSGWVISAAPLLLSFDVSSPTLLTPTRLSMLSNPEVIAVDQDPAVVQGVKVLPPGGNATGTECWARPLSTNGGNTTAVFMINRGTVNADINCTWTAIAPTLLTPTTTATVRDLWMRQDLGNFTGYFVATNVPPHGSRLLTVVPVV